MEQQNEIKDKANMPLQTYLRVCAFLVPLFLGGMLSDNFKDDEYKRRIKESWLWTFYGVSFYIGLAMLLTSIF